MKVTITNLLTTQHVMEHAHSRYWFNAHDPLDLAPEHRKYLPKAGRVANWPKLTDKRLREGVQAMTKWATLKRDGYAAAMLGRVHTAQGDGSDLDVLLQFSLFGKVIYV